MCRMGSNLIDPATNRSVFTFLSEFNKSWEGQTVIEITVLSIILIAALTGNCMVLSAVYRNEKLRTATNILICNLASTDILFAAGIPFIATTRITQHWIFGNFVCKTVTYIQFVSGVCSITTMMVISIERYISVCKHKKQHLTRKHVVVILVVLWVISIMFPLPVAIAQKVKEFSINETVFTYCGIEWWEGFPSVLYLGSMVSFFFTLPLIVITIFYFKILRIVRGSMRRTQSGSFRVDKSPRKQIRLLKMFGSIVLLFVFMWLPFFIISFLGVHYKQITSSQFTITLILALTNTCQNPIIYGYFNYRFREEFKSMCCYKSVSKTGSSGKTYEMQETEMNSNNCNNSSLC